MTGFLIDTHVLLWWADAPQQLSEDARIAIAGGRNPLFFSYASIWELTIKISSGKLKIPESTTLLMQRARCTPLPISIAHIETIVQLPHHHRDPFDRMLIAQARADNLTLVTRDAKIKNYDVAILAA